jgi:predicted MFS family arabinose efflux permease
LSFLAVLKGSFLLFCTGCFLVGVYQAFSQYYRLVAADHSPPEVKGQSISLVMIGGVVAAILGPLLTIIARDVPGLPRFAGVYLVVAMLGILSALNLALFLDREKRSPCPGQRRASARVTDQSAVNETCGLPYGLASPGRGLLRDAFSYDGGPSLRDAPPFNE